MYLSVCMVNTFMLEDYKDKFPFLTGLTYSESEYIGIVVNYDNQIVTFYDLEKIPTTELRKEFVKLGETWWWESNRQIPIDVFLHHEMRSFTPFIRTFISKDVEHLFGPMTSLQNLLKKRIKRKGIQLVKKID